MISPDNHLLGGYHLLLYRTIFTNEAQYTSERINNSHIWADENPHRLQNRFLGNVWIGVIDRQVIGPTYLMAPLDFLRNILPN